MKLRFGIMGAGGIAVRFVNAVGMVDDVCVTAVASKNLERAQAFAESQKIPLAFGSYEEMAQSGEIDAVYVANTGNFHFDSIMLALRSGLAVLCEKNMVCTVREAEQVFALAKEKNLFVMEGMWSDFIPCVQKARQWIEEGKIGPVQIATYTGGINAWPEHRIFVKELAGGALYDLGVYPIEIVGYILGRNPESAIAKVKMGETGVDVTVNMIVTYGDVDASLQCTCRSRIPSPSAFCGPGGYIMMEKTHMAEKVSRYDGQFKLVEEYYHPFENGFQYEIVHMRDCIRAGLIESPVVTWETTLSSTRIYEQILGT